MLLWLVVGGEAKVTGSGGGEGAYTCPHRYHFLGPLDKREGGEGVLYIDRERVGRGVI